MFRRTTQSKLKHPRDVALDRKLDIALRESILTDFFQRIKDRKRRYVDDLLITVDPQYYQAFPSTTSTAAVLSSIIQNNVTLEYHGGVDLRRVYKLACTNLRFQHEYLMEGNRLLSAQENEERFERFMTQVHITPDLYRAMVWCEELSEMVEHLGVSFTRPRQGEPVASELARQAELQKFVSRRVPLDVRWAGQLCTIRACGNHWIAPKSALLQMHNKVSDFISVMLLAQLSSGVNLEKDAYSLTRLVILELCELHLHYPTRYFSIAGSLEGLCTGIILEREEEWTNDTLVNVLSAELAQDCGYRFLGSRLHDLLSQCSTPLVAEVSCLAKITGHPHVSTSGGLEKLRKRTSANLPISPAAVGFCAAAIKESFVISFIHRHKRWPSAYLTASHVHGAIKEAWARGISPHSRQLVMKYGKPPTGDWVYVELGEELRFQKLSNMIPYLQDKTISPLRSQLTQMWISNERIPYNNRRLLLHYMLTSSLTKDHLAFLEEYCKSDEDMSEVKDYLAIKLVPKEKELKIDFRGFGCMTYMSRTKMLLQEKNVMHFLDLYSDEQAMTLSEFALMRKLRSFRALRKVYRDCYLFQINCDASGWCSKWRDATVAPPMQRTLDKIFGVNIFSRTQEWYENTLFYMEDGSTTYTWDGQKGGIEGLSQDTWVVLYTAQIKYAFRETGYRFHVLCKGDDLRIMVAVPKTELDGISKKQFLEDLIEKISRTAGLFGQNLKAQESYGSETFMSFSKQFSLESAELSSQYRKIQKCYGSNNAILPTLDDYIGASFANAHAACYVGQTHYSCYTVALVWSFFYLLQAVDPPYAHEADDLLGALMLTPSIMGGFPIIFLHNFFVRAESDFLSSFCDIVMYAQRSGSPLAVHLVNVLEQPMSYDPSRYLLALDPYGLPLTRPQNPKTFLRNQMGDALRPLIIDSDLKRLFHECHPGKKREFLNVLTSSTDVIQSRIIAAIYSASPFAIVDELIASFDSGKSIWKMLLFLVRARKAIRALRKALVLDRRLNLWRLSMLKRTLVGRTIPRLDTECPLHRAKHIRAEAYQIPVVTVNNPPMAHFLTFVSPVSSQNRDYDRDNHFRYVRVHEWETFDPRPAGPHYRASSETPFLGYKTTTGTQEPEVHMIEKDPILSKIKQLLSLYSWCNISAKGVMSNVPELLTEMLRWYTDVPMSELSPFRSARKSGTATHHLRGQDFREGIVPNCRSNIYTMIKGESNSHHRFRGIVGHQNVNYLQIYCHSVTVAHISLQFSSVIDTDHVLWVVTSPCPHCNELIEEGPIVLDDTRYWRLRMPEIKTIRVGKEAEGLLLEALAEFKAKIEGTPPLDLLSELMPLEAAHHTILEVFFQSTMHDISELRDRYDVHQMGEMAQRIFNDISTTSKSGQISLTELKRIPAATIAGKMLDYATGYLAGDEFRNSASTLAVIIALTPPYGFPWTFCCTMLFRAGILEEVLRAVKDVSQHPHGVCDIEPNSATLYIARCASTMVGKHYHCRVEITVDPTTTAAQLRHRIYRRAPQHRIHLAKKILSEAALEPILTEQDYTPDRAINWMETLLQVVVVFLAPVVSAEHLQKGLALGTYHHHGLEYEEVQLKHLKKVISMNWNFRQAFTDLTQEYQCNYPIRALGEADIEEIENAGNVLTNLPEEYQMRIRCYDLNSSIITVRGQDLAYQEFQEVYPHEQKHPIAQVVGYLRGATVIPPVDTVKYRYEYRTQILEQLDPSEDYDLAHLSGWVGYGYPSPALIAEILASLKLSPSSLQGILVCFGDTLGAISRWLLENAPKAYVHYHDQGILDDPVHPLIAMQAQHRHRFFMNHCHAGVNDLRYKAAFQRQQSLVPLNVTLIISDIDIDPNDESYVQAWFHVVRIYLTSRANYTLLVLKISLHMTVSVSRLVTMLSYYCQDVRVYNCNLSTRGYTAYILAQGIRRPYADALTTHLPETNPMVKGKIDTLYQQRNRFIIQENHGLSIRGALADVMIKKIHLQSKLGHDTLISILQSRCCVPPEIIPATLQMERPHKWFTETLQASLNSLRSHWWSARDVVTAGDRETLNHKYRILEQLIMITVACEVVAAYPNLDRPSNHTLYESIKYSLRDFRDVHLNVDYHKDTEKIVFTPTTQAPFKGKEHVLVGLNIGLAIQGWLRADRESKTYRKYQAGVCPDSPESDD